jgi:mRNA interferase MazF
MRAFQRGQIWLVNFDPSFGHEYQKVRPALIIQHDKYITSSQLLTVIPISSQTSKFTELDILLKKDLINRLMKDSLVKIKQISSFDKRRFIKFIGVVNHQTLEQVDKNIQLFLFGQ